MTDQVPPAGLVELLRDLVAIPSVNPSIAPGEGTGEAAVAAFARDWLAARGVRAWLDPCAARSGSAAPGRPNAIAEVGDRGPRLVFCAHLDTVGTAGMTIPPFEPRVEGDRLYGRGAYDMKGGVAAVMVALAELAGADLPGRVLLALVSDEEYASIGAEDAAGRYPADGCVLVEPSEGRLILGHKGFVWAEIETAGRAAHGSRWDLGVSAIGRMGRVVAALERFDREELRARVDRLVGPASLHCALIEGGVGLSTYAPSCRLKVERRTLPAETTEDALEELRRVVRAAGEEAEVRRLFDRPPMTCDRDAPVARAVRSAAASVTGSEPEETGVAYWMDAALFAAAGMPTVDYGPSGAGAHEAVEWVDLPSVARTARVLVEAARRFLDGGRP